RIEAATALLSEAFEDDPTIVYLLSFPTKAQQLAYTPTYFRTLLTAAALNNASIDEVDDWKSCGIMMPPDSSLTNPLTLIPAGFASVIWTLGLGGLQRMLWEMSPLTSACKAKGLRANEKYYYVFFLGTSREARGRGLCSAMVRHYQSVAASAQLPIWMEAATEYCLRLYLRLGFVVVKMVLGKGKAAADGNLCEGGPGVKIWGMVWRPESVS
ncbi:hypothetical protein MMC12_008645, partial [Toensbergia leucococca]|nr:hypothetical protein [Toensbergia leucococca]